MRARHLAEAICPALFFDLFRIFMGMYLSIFEKMCYTNAAKVFEQAGYNPAVR